MKHRPGILLWLLLALGFAMSVHAAPEPVAADVAGAGVSVQWHSAAVSLLDDEATAVTATDAMHADALCHEANDGCVSPETCCPAAAAEHEPASLSSAPHAVPSLSTASLTESVVPTEIRPPISSL